MGSMITVRVDDELKSEFEDFCSNVGTNTSTLINMFMKNVTREKRLPFDVKYYSEGARREKANKSEEGV
jgi:DNA-damage-inducible protein J